MSEMKLQKALQDAGLGNRRLIRQLINEGKIRVNNRIVTNPNFPLDIEHDLVHLKKKELKIRLQPKCYFILNKPDGVVSTLFDPQKRPAISDLIVKIRERVVPVGRLDFHSEGLILLTNDGELTNFILSARNRVPKTYLVKIKGALSPETKKKLEKGIFMEGERLNPFRIEFIRQTTGGHSWWRVTITEGKKHILRKAFLFSGHPVERLKRTAIGTIRLKSLPAGEWRELTQTEIKTFFRTYGVSSGQDTETSKEKRPHPVIRKGTGNRNRIKAVAGGKKGRNSV